MHAVKSSRSGLLDSGYSSKSLRERMSVFEARRKPQRRSKALSTRGKTERSQRTENFDRSKARRRRNGERRRTRAREWPHMEKGGVDRRRTSHGMKKGNKTFRKSAFDTNTAELRISFSLTETVQNVPFHCGCKMAFPISAES
ncbi:hypothetical protein TGCAST_389150 [Toxoplasma gondii CAST]|uniref:Uncharacterized protein n=1 Tax=Toxoplasma gondii CAST TaxID=943122 RepID=A0A425HR63_TOXGO|nr:hypothetical protein TGCAST_389150 [Toxoplasma gondii CAST]